MMAPAISYCWELQDWRLSPRWASPISAEPVMNCARRIKPRVLAKTPAGEAGVLAHSAVGHISDVSVFFLRAVAVLRPVLRAVRAVFRPVLRAVRAVFRPVLRAVRAVFRPVLRAVLAVLRAVRAVLRPVLRVALATFRPVLRTVRAVLRAVRLVVAITFLRFCLGHICWFGSVASSITTHLFAFAQGKSIFI